MAPLTEETTPTRRYGGPAVVAANGAPAGAGLTVRDAWRMLVKRRVQVAMIAGAVLAVSLAYTLLATPMYSATATVQIETSALRVVNTASLEVVDPNGDFIGTQIQLLRSRSLAGRAVRSLGLVADRQFQQVMHQPRGWRGVVAYFRSDAKRSGQDAPLEQREAEATGILMNGLSVKPVGRTRLVEVSFVSPDAHLAAVIANGIAAAFMQANLDRRVDNTLFARDFLQDRLQQTKLKLEQSERALIKYSQDQNIANVDEYSSLAAKNLAALSTDLAVVQSERIKAEAQLAQIDAIEGVSLDGLKGPVLEGLRQKLVELQADYEARRSTYKPDYPDMVQLARRIREVQSQIVAEKQAFARATQAQARAAQLNEDLLLREIGKLQTEVLGLQGRGIEYTILKREADTNRQLYDGLLQRFKELGVEGDAGANNISLVDRAENGSLFEPSFSANLLRGGLLGLLLGFAVAFLLEKLDDTIKSPDAIERELELSLMGIVPNVPADAFLEAKSAPKSSLSEAYRSLRTALQYATADGAPRLLAITSSVPGEGKSTSSEILAVQFAQLGLRVLVVDADLRKPSLHRRFELKNDQGLSSLLTGQSTVAEVVQSVQPNLFVVTGGACPPNPAELLSGAKFRAFLAAAKEQYDQVIVDCPPMLGLADMPIIAGVVDGVMLVVSAGGTRRGVALASIKRLQSSHATLLGAVLVKFDARATGYGYGDGYGYADYRYSAAGYSESSSGSSRSHSG